MSSPLFGCAANAGTTDWPCDAEAIDAASFGIAAGAVGLMMVFWLNMQVCGLISLSLYVRCVLILWMICGVVEPPCRWRTFWVFGFPSDHW